MRRYNLLIN